jgi:hypothetical protein
MQRMNAPGLYMVSRLSIREEFKDTHSRVHTRTLIRVDSQLRDKGLARQQETPLKTTKN